MPGWLICGLRGLMPDKKFFKHGERNPNFIRDEAGDGEDKA